MSCESRNNSATCDCTPNNSTNSHNSRGENVRNICTMAHVDHGKTTLTDSLIATNGIISEKQAGSIRYMDSRSDEMERGITMKSSCITLAYPHNNQSYLVNLVDSPGHVDFTSEVSTAVRLCDGCILVVDVVEGVCAQTKSVMRQAWVAGVKPVLVLNKLDRLVTEKELSPLDAYYHLANVLQQVNAYMGELYNTDVMGRTSLPVSNSCSSENPDGGTANESLLGHSRSLGDWCIEDVDDSDLYFNPTAGNVVFASAVDGWGFGISHFAEQFSNKLGMSHKALSQTLWGDYYISNKNGQKRVLKGARDKRKNPLFVTLILENLYHLYRKVRPATANVEDIKKIADSLNVKVPARLYQTASESKARFIHIISNWLPLSRAVLDMVVLQVPPPTRITEDRARKLLTTATHDYSSLPLCSQVLLPHLQHCSNTDTAPLIVYVSKMFGVSKKKLDEAEEALQTAQSNANGSSKPTPSRRNFSLPPRSSCTSNGVARDGEMPPRSSSTSNGSARDGEMPPRSSNTSNGAARDGGEMPALSSCTSNGAARDGGEMPPRSSNTSNGAARDGGEMLPRSSCTSNGAAGDGGEMPPRSSSTSNGAARDSGDMPSRSSCTSNGAAHNDREKISVAGTTLEDYSVVEREEEEELLAFARVFSGSLKAGQEVYVLGPKHDPALLAPHLTPEQHLPDDVLQRCSYITKCKVSGVFLLLGREVKALSAAGAGLMVGVRGLAGHIIKSGSVSSTPACPPFTHVIHSTSALGACGSAAAGSDPSGPLLRVQVLPRNPRCLKQLREGLRLLNQADPCVQVWLEATGEYIVGAAGEVHLQRCLADLEERYARVPVTASDPIVPFRETVVPRPLLDQTKEAIQGDNIHTNQQVGDGSVCTETFIGRVRVRAVPLPASVVELLSAHTALLTAVSSRQSTATSSAAAQKSSDDNQVIGDLAELDLLNTSEENVCPETSASLQEDLNESLVSVTSSDVDAFSMPSLQSVVSVQRLSEESRTALSSLHLKMSEAFDAAGAEWRGAANHVWSVGPHYSGPNVLLNRVSHYHRPPLWQHTTPLPTDSPLSAMDHGLVTGFQLCCATGPLCEEPLRGVCFVIEEWTPPTQSEPLPPGKIIAVAKDLFLSALQEQPRRMMVAMYSCVVSVTSEVLGRVYSVLGRRHGRILHGDITEGSTSWNVTAYLPIVESIDFANEIRKATSGEAQPQLVFSHWETLDMDPFWEPCTSEELKHFGEKSDTSNLALQYMNAVRRRKGLKEYGKKLVEFGEKQRTLTKNK